MPKKKPAGEADPLLKAFDERINEGEELLREVEAAGLPTKRPKTRDELEAILRSERECESCLPRRVEKWAESCKDLVGFMYLEFFPEHERRPDGKDPCDPIIDAINRHKWPDPWSHFVTLTECVEQVLDTMQSKREILVIRLAQRRKQEHDKAEAAGGQGDSMAFRLGDKATGQRTASVPPGSDVHDLFISFADDDSEIAEELKRELEVRGLRCFMSKKDLRPLRKWDPSIRSALVGSRGMVLVMTPRSKDKPWVLLETGAAWVLEIPIVAALQQVPAKELVDPVGDYQAFQIETGPQRVRLIDKLVKELKGGHA